MPCLTCDSSSPAPNQHHPLSYLRQKSGNTGSSLLLAALSHIHSKTACRGFKSFCPCQKQRYCFCSGAVFCHWTERLGNEARLRPAQCVSWGERAPVALCCEPTEAAAETKSFCPCHKTGENTGFSPVSFFSCVVWLCGAFGFRFWGSPPVRTDCTPLQHPKRTRFRLFRTISGAFRCFYPLLTCKIFGLAFVHLAA